MTEEFPPNNPQGEIKEEPLKEGWVWFLNSKKAHYVKELRALCGRWMYLGSSFEQGKDDSPDNCTECRRRLIKMREKYAKRKD
jgi:DNA-directed RNA polymerase subunit RPC12/RpoP